MNQLLCCAIIIVCETLPPNENRYKVVIKQIKQKNIQYNKL